MSNTESDVTLGLKELDQAMKDQNTAKRITDRIVRNIDGRNCGFDSLDSDVRKEIKEDLKKIVLEELKKAKEK